MPKLYISEKDKLKNEIDYFLKKLFPLCRSITGSNNRKTLNELKKIIPLNISEISSGTKVFDWVIPKEWSIEDAYILDKNKTKIIDFKNSNLHIVSYSKPVEKEMYWDELKNKIYTHDKLEDAIPYRTSYYKEDWGFCITKKQYQRLSQAAGPFKVVIKSELKKGSLSFGEYLLKGSTKKEIIISSYICHPSMANDSLSGVILSSLLARAISKNKKRKWNYRFIFVPETIGAISYCYQNENIIKAIDVGLLITTVGGRGSFSYKQTWNNRHWINFLIEKNFKSIKKEFKTYPFDIHGSDERQFSSQGFRINMASIFKDKYYEYKEYHSSMDNLDFVNSDQIYESYEVYLSLFEKLESLNFYKNTKQNCEIMLSKYDLYPKLGGAFNNKNHDNSLIDKILWILFLSDGKTPIEKISYDLGYKNENLEEIIKKLMDLKLIKKV